MKAIDLTGNRFGRLTVLYRAEDRVESSGKRRIMWMCRCDCGTEKAVLGENLRSGKTLSCGCFARENTSRCNSTHHDSESQLYAVWSSIKARCYNPHNAYFSRYGGRGIRMCDEWRNSYETFREWMLQHGYTERSNRSITIDRIDNDNGYYPANCRLVSAKVQANNRCSCKWYTYDGRTMNIAQWAECANINYKKLYHRLSLGWDFERAITTP